MSSISKNTEMTSRPVVILGAGIGGLTLGRCLKHKGIPSIIYDRAPDKPRHTYGMTLESWAYKPLLQYLGFDEHKFKRRLAVDNLYKHGVGKYAKHDEGEVGKFRANRWRFESFLRESLDIKSEHQLSTVNPNNDTNSLELLFEDGLRLESEHSLVIDATGVHSPLRQSLLPDISPSILSFVAFNGKRYVSSELFQQNYTKLLGNGNMASEQSRQSGKPRLEVAVNDHRDNGEVSISYIYSRKAKYEGSDLLHRPDRDKAEATDINEAFYEEAKQTLEDQDLSAATKDAFDIEKLRKDRLLHWLMRTVLVPRDDLKKLLAFNVVLIGDSSHATPILGGKGANSAVLDAIQLAEAISVLGTDKEALDKFYESRWPVWNDEVEASVRAIEDMHAGQGSRL